MTSSVIGDHVELQRGTTYKSALLDQPGPVLLGLGSIERDGGFRSEKLRTYGGPSPDKLLVYPGDLYVSLKDVTQSGDLLGSIARVPDGVTVGRMTQDTVKLCFVSDISRIYFYWLLRTPQYRQHCRSHATGTTNLGLSRDDFFAFEIPQLSDAREIITNILERIEQKITLNRQINQTLEQIAQAIFKNWFVDFEPVKAKQHIRALGGNDEQTERAAQAVVAGAVNLDVITTATDLGELGQELVEALSEKLAHQTDAQREQLATTASHFPDQLVESELGLIPEGWEVTILSKMVTLIGGGTPKRSEARYWGGEIPWFSVKDAPSDGQVFVLDTDLKITEDGLNESSARLLDEGVTIISARGTVGRLALVGVPMAMNQSCYGVAGSEGVPPIYNYFNLRHAVDVLKQNTHGAVFDTITRATFETVVQVGPATPILESFDTVMSPLLQQIKENLRIGQALESTRVALLPKLLSGEIEIQKAA